MIVGIFLKVSPKSNWTRFRDGFAQVLLYGKWKFIGKDGKFLTKQWFDFCDRFRDGFALVQLDGKWNFIDKDGKLLSEQWFDNCGYVHEGFAKVQLDGKWYNIDTHGRLTQAESLLSQVINSIFRD